MVIELGPYLWMTQISDCKGEEWLCYVLGVDVMEVVCARTTEAKAHSALRRVVECIMIGD